MDAPSRIRGVGKWLAGLFLGAVLFAPGGWSNTPSGRYCKLDAFTHLDRQLGPRGRLGAQGQSNRMALALSFIDLENLPYTAERNALVSARAKLKTAQWEWDDAQRHHHGTGQVESPAAQKSLQLAAAQLQTVGEQLLPGSPWQLSPLSEHIKLYDQISAIESRISALQQILLEKQKAEGPKIIFEKHVRPYLLPVLEHLQGSPVEVEQIDVMVDSRIGHHHVIVRDVWLKEDAQKILADFNIFVFEEDLFSLAKAELEAGALPEGAATDGAFTHAAFRFHFAGSLPQFGTGSPGGLQTYVSSKFYVPLLLPLLRYFEAQGWLVNHIRPEFQAQTGKMYFDVPEPRPTAPDRRVTILDISIRNDALAFLKRHFRVGVEPAKGIKLEAGYYVPSSRPRDPYGSDAKIQELRKFLPGGDGGIMTKPLYREFRSWLERRKLSWSEVQSRFDEQEGGIEVELASLGTGHGYRWVYKFVKTSYSSQTKYPRPLSDPEIEWLKEFIADEMKKRKGEIDFAAAGQEKNHWGY